MKLSPEDIRKLAKMTLEARPAEVSCEDWIHMVGEYVEGSKGGADLTEERMRTVWQHAKDCAPCMDELHALEGLLADGPETEPADGSQETRDED